MKLTGQLFKPAASLLAVAALFLATSAHALTKGQARVANVQGTASYMDARGASGNITAGMILSEGATIITGSNSTVDLDLGVNGEVVRVKAKSRLSLNQLDIITTGIDPVVETTLELKEGSVAGNVKKVSGASKYNIKTVKGVAGIRGTSFLISQDGTCHVTSGVVVMIFMVGNVPSAPITVPAGMSVTPPTTPGGAPTIAPTPANVVAVARVDINDATKQVTTTSPDAPPAPPTPAGSPPVTIVVTLPLLGDTNAPPTAKVEESPQHP